MTKSTDESGAPNDTAGEGAPNDTAGEGAPVASAVAELVESSEATSYDKLGYHHKHVASPDKLRDLAQAFRDHGYILEMITCQDRREDLEKMRLVYTYAHLSHLDRHLLHADVDEDVDAPTLCDIYRGADWLEREVYDMYGVRFVDHPNLKRILLPEDADFFALRKDFGRMEDAEAES